MGDPPDDKDSRVEGGNPCLEQVRRRIWVSYDLDTMR